MANIISGIIDREEGDFIIIRLGGEQELYWPKNNINFHYSINDQVNIGLSREETINADNATETKNILRQIFQPNVSTQ